MFDNINLEFPVTIYGNLEKYNETISKARCRIFYKYGNRNGTYITDEFAEKLLSSIPYAPIKGIYEEDGGDYTDHGSSRNQGRIYGVVPENPNITWEAHVDEDGIERIYVCTDVLIFTSLYTEAKAIVGKSQSMELYPPSIKGEWKILEGKKYYVFSEGCFLGLQVLGEDVEPCFEGAAFFTLYEKLSEVVNQLREYGLNLHNGGSKEMNFKLSDNEKYQALWSLLNPNYNQENDWAIECGICEVYDEYAIIRNYVNSIYERVYYTKDDETNSVSIDRREECYIIDVNAIEKAALEALHKLNNNTYENINENYSTLTANLETAEQKNADYEEKISEFELKIVEQENTISTLNTDKEDGITKLADAQMAYTTLAEEVEALRQFKKQVVFSEKESVIAKYEKFLSAEVLASYTSKIDEYETAKDLDKDLAYAYVSTNQNVFSTNANPTYIPKDETPLTGLEGILSKYRK